MRNLFCFLILLFSLNTHAQQEHALSITLENVNYPHPISFLKLNFEGQDLRMAYMDIKPIKPNDRTIMLLHGKNFGGYYWTNVIQSLVNEGYHVIVPDQIGFGKSSKPFINYSFHTLAAFNKLLLDSLGVQKVSIMGHSMGGMLASRPVALPYCILKG
jgi:pimeloyl-ACP methyl ester carboxylesterase